MHTNKPFKALYTMVLEITALVIVWWCIVPWVIDYLLK